jgi:hypothetical protein
MKVFGGESCLDLETFQKPKKNKFFFSFVENLSGLRNFSEVPKKKIFFGTFQKLFRKFKSGLRHFQIFIKVEYEISLQMSNLSLY